jgi:uncharacterized protein YprB with RNaseH-like and TPR domain
MHAAENLKQRIDSTKEYQVISESENQGRRNGGIQDGQVFESDYDQALRLKTELIRKFKGKRLEDAIPGKVLSNLQGECYCVVDTHEVQFERARYDESKRLLLADLKLIPGIGAAREQMLKNQNYHSIKDLKKHPKWRNAATEFSQLVERKDILALQEQLRKRLPKSHPLSHYLAGFCRDEDFAIIDIETMGLFGRPIILLGVAEATKGKVITRQFLVRNIAEEACALQEFTSKLNAGSVFVSFNGRCFDVPFIRERLAYYGLDAIDALRRPHFDVLHFARRVFRGRVANCRLETLETTLGIQRSINIPGALVPEFYDSYQRSGNVGPLVAIMEHNRQDLVTLARLFCSLYKEYD